MPTAVLGRNKRIFGLKQGTMSDKVSFSIAFIFLLLATTGSKQGLSTPTLAIKESDNCGGCHNNGRSQRPVALRRCTLDCAGCHIDPSGAGARNQWGYYYSMAEMNTLSFFQPQDPLQDTSRFDIHVDNRVISIQQPGNNQTSPMSSEITFRLRPLVEYLHLTYTGIFLGKMGDNSLFEVSSDNRRFRENYAVMIDQIPMNLFLRGGRIRPTYGLRRPNHSAWIRERIGLNQFAITDGIEFGGSPNVPFFRVAKMDGSPYDSDAAKQKGHSAHAGFRGVSLGWNINGSYWDTKSQESWIKMTALGGGFKLFKTIFYYERNWRRIGLINSDTQEESDDSSGYGSDFNYGIYPASTISDFKITFAQLPGIMFGYNYETLRDAVNDSLRRTFFADFHILPFLQFEILRRYEGGTRSYSDTVGVLHTYLDW